MTMYRHTRVGVGSHSLLARLVLAHSLSKKPFVSRAHAAKKANSLLMAGQFASDVCLICTQNTFVDLRRNFR